MEYFPKILPQPLLVSERKRNTGPGDQGQSLAWLIRHQPLTLSLHPPASPAYPCLQFSYWGWLDTFKPVRFIALIIRLTFKFEW
jgi:hypothetical protein